MCGIAGEIRINSQQTEADWQAISLLMKRRGPDDEGAWHSDRCSMVFRRLSIMDLSPAGHQPMQSPDQRYALCFNGELYNWQALRKTLEGHGVDFRSDGDTEVVLQALIRWGVDALAKFNGMFAIAFYDTQAGKLLLARDHAGIKPLYYLRARGGLVYASQYDQLLRHPWRAECAIDPSALALYLQLGFVPAPHALLSNTHMLEPGAWLEIDTNGAERGGKYFELPRYAPATLKGREAIEAVDAAISDAVRRQLVADVPVASFLSGGVDSPLVLAKMLETGGGPYRAFTIGTGEAKTDESADAALYAEQLGVQQTIEHVDDETAIGMLDDVVRAASEPFADYSLFPTMLVSRLAARDFKVILSGDGGDELFWGYVKRFAEGLNLLPEFSRSTFARRSEWWMRRMTRRMQGRHHLSFADLGAWQRYKHSPLRGNQMDRLFPQMVDWPHTYRSFDFDQHEPDRAAQWLRWNEFTTYLTKVLLKVDRASMHESLEVRVPLLDRAVVETAWQVDWRSCLDVNDGLGKLPLRELLSRHVKQQTSAKRGFEVPMGTWLRGPLKELFMDRVVASEDLLGMPIQQDYLQGLFEQHCSGKQDLAQGLWPLLALTMWSDTHLSAPALAA